MSDPPKTKPPGGHRAASRSNYTRVDSSTAYSQEKRPAEHWFLDAAIFARDGDAANARRAALRGIDALQHIAAQDHGAAT